MKDRQGRRRGTPNLVEFQVGLWVLFGLCAMIAAEYVSDDTVWRLALAILLLGVAMTGFYIAVRLIRRGYPDSEDD